MYFDLYLDLAQQTTSILHIFNFFIVILLQLSHFPPLPSSTQPTLYSHINSHAVVHVHGSFIHVLCLVPSPSFHHYAPAPSPLVTVSLLHVSITLVLFCSFVCFVYYVPLLSEIIWYLSFTDWLISLSIIFSSLSAHQ